MIFVKQAIYFVLKAKGGTGKFPTAVNIRFGANFTVELLQMSLGLYLCSCRTDRAP